MPCFFRKAISGLKWILEAFNMFILIFPTGFVSFPAANFKPHYFHRMRIFFFFLFTTAIQAQHLPTLPVWPESNDFQQPADWLVKSLTVKAEVYRSADQRDIMLYNGLLTRRFRIIPDVVCYDFSNRSNGQQLLRALAPEARLMIDGVSYTIGGLKGQPEKAYFRPEWLEGLTPWAADFKLEKVEVAEIQPQLHWEPRTWALNRQQPSGKALVFNYIPIRQTLSGISVTLRYELYDGIPLVVKSLTVHNQSGHEIVIGASASEILALVEEESSVGGNAGTLRKQHGLYVETDYNFGTDVMRPEFSARAVQWKTDSAYTSQVNWDYQSPCLLEISPDKVPAIPVPNGQSWQSVRAFELLMDSYDRERRGLALRCMYRTVAPWTSQNPIFMHLVSQQDQQVKDVVDQCVATGYEAIILSFGSHCNMEDTSAANIARWRSLADYAHQKGILLGSYSLFSSRRISEADDVIDPVTGQTGHAIFLNAPCFGSQWGQAYAQKLKYFMRETGFDLFENDGPYPGDLCASTTHPGHRNLGDSQWRQVEMQHDLYRWCNENGVYVNAPDWYFLSGSNKIALGYREVNFSLSREQQKMLNRQNIYDGTWEKTPSMGWGFVPLTRYQGGDEEAVLEPLNAHLADYEQLMVQYYGAGVQACYRGPRLYDTEATKQMVRRTISWYKQYRDILNSDIIHLRRPDGRDWDGILHVNPALPVKGFLMLYNPLKTPILRSITVPLYYAGLDQKATFSGPGFKKQVKLNRNYEARIEVLLPAEGWLWLAVE